MLLAGCTSATGPDAELPADTDYPLAMTSLTSPVAPEQSVQVRLENNGPTRLGFNLCTDGDLERSVGGGWVVLSHQPYPCALVLSALDPGGRVTLHYSIPSDAPEGTYRLRIRFLSMAFGGMSIIRRSDSFLVRD